MAERVAGIGPWDEEHEPARVPDVSYDDLGLAGVPLPLERDRVGGVLACVELNKHDRHPFCFVHRICPRWAAALVGIETALPDQQPHLAIAGLGIFGAFTIFDFNRVCRVNADSAVVIAASIFLDIFNVFLLALDLFGGQRD